MACRRGATQGQGPSDGVDSEEAFETGEVLSVTGIQIETVGVRSRGYSAGQLRRRDQGVRISERGGWLSPFR